MHKIILIFLTLFIASLYAKEDINATLKTLSKQSMEAFKNEDYSKVIEIEKQSFKLGNKISSNYIASMYQFKFLDFDNAEIWYKKGVQNKIPSSAHNLGSMYKELHKYKLAEKYYLIAAELGDKYTPYVLGLFYVKNLDDYEKSKEWFKKSFELGEAKGAFALGNVYKKEKNYKEAEVWYLKAMNLNYIRVPYTLAKMYEEDTKEYKKALAMYKKVVQQSPKKSPKSKEAIKRLEKLLK